MVAEGVFVTGDRTAYCTEDEVLSLLAGYDTSRLGTAEEVRARIRQLLEPTRAAVDAEAGRDFLFHADDTIFADGDGTGMLSLAAFGARPLQAVHGLTVAGRLVSSDEYVSYVDEGLVRLRPSGELDGRFPVGVQNMSVSLDWGYLQAPGDIGLAQAKLLGAQLLAEAAGERGSVESMKLGDYSVSYDAGGEHAGVIARWLDDARRVARSYRQLRVVAI